MSPLKLRYSPSGFLTDLLGGSGVIALSTGHLEYGAAAMIGLCAVLLRDREERRHLTRRS